MSGLLAVDRCPLCGRPAADAAPIHAPRGGVAIQRCRACGLAFASAYAEAAAIEADYGARAERDAAAIGERPGVARRRSQLRLYDRLSRGRIGRAHPGARALDVGCNAGLLLDALRELGYATAGIERSPAARLAEEAGHTILRADVEALEDLAGAGGPGERYDLITITHVLEHLRRPVAALEWIGRHLADAGLAVIEVPNFDDLGGRLWGAAYRPLELGDHLSFFERDTLAAAIERAGLQLLELWSAPQAATLVFPSALTAVDQGLARLRRLRPVSPASAPAGLDRSARVRGGGRLSRIVEPMVAALARLDPLLEARFGGECLWGANLVAIVGR